MIQFYLFELFLENFHKDFVLAANETIKMTCSGAMYKLTSLRVESLKSGKCSVAVTKIIVHFGCVGGTLKCSFVCSFVLFSLLVGSDFSCRHLDKISIFNVPIRTTDFQVRRRKMRGW